MDTLHWTSNGVPLPKIPETSRLDTLEISDIPLAIDLRQHIADVVSIRGKAIGSAPVRSRLVIRDGVVLHFDFYSSGSAERISLASDIKSMIRDAEDELADLGLRADYVSICIDTKNEPALDALPIQALGDVWTVRTPSTSPACLTLFDMGIPSLLYLDGCQCHSQADAVSIWYVQATSCLASKELLNALRMTVQGTAKELHEATGTKVSISLRSDFGVAFQAQTKLDEIRDSTNKLMAHHAVILDYRRFGMSIHSETDAHRELYAHLDQEYKLYYGEALDIAIDALRATTLEAEKRSKSFLELSNMAYNVAIQESLKLLQWLGLAIAAASLLAAIASIVVATQGG